MSSSAVDYRAVVAEREKHIREAWVHTMEVRITREALIKCQQSEGVNHYETCKTLASKYTDMLQDAKVKGYRTIEVD